MLALTGDVRTHVGTGVAADADMPKRAKVNDVRLPGAWIPHELLNRIRAAVGDRGFSAFARQALEREIARVEARSRLRSAK